MVPLISWWALGFDETPLKYFVEQKGHMRYEGVQNVFVSCSREKRMLTGGPVTNEKGGVVSPQIIWEGNHLELSEEKLLYAKESLCAPVMHGLPLPLVYFLKMEEACKCRRSQDMH